jgi:hypothetical protein
MEQVSNCTLLNTMQAELSPHLSDYIRPLSEATVKLLQPDTLIDTERERLRVSVRSIQGVDDERPYTRWVLTPEPKKSGDIPSMHSLYKWWQRVPGAYAQHGLHPAAVVPATDVSALVIVAIWGKENLVFDDQIAKMSFWTCFAQFVKQTRVAEYQARFKHDKHVPPQAPAGNISIGKGLMPHQRVAALCLLESDNYALFKEQSTGKTPTVIAAMDIDSKTKPNVLNLIVCPKNVRSQWANEIQEFSERKVNIIQIRGDKITRIKQLLTAFEYRNQFDYTCVIVSYEGLCGTLSQFVAFLWRWGVTDESHNYKWYRTKRWKALEKVRDSCEKRTALTGTPICNMAFDLWTQLEWLGDQYSGFPSFTAFKNFYGNFEPVGHGYERLMSMKNLPLLQERLTRSAFLITKKEAMPDLPAKTYEIIEAEMQPQQKLMYEQLATTLHAEIERELGSEEPSSITVNNILTQLLRLTQITSGFVALDGEIDLDTGEVISRVIERFDPNPKLEVLIETVIECLQNNPRGKILIWCSFIQDIKTIRARLGIEGIKCVAFYGATKDQERIDNVITFNTDPTVPVFVGNPGAGGVGLNLQGYCMGQCITDTVMIYSQDWSMPKRSQCEERPRGYMHEGATVDNKRITWSIRVIDFCVLDSIDFEIRKRVHGKRMHALKVQDIKEILKGLL